MKLLKNANVYTPSPIGKKDILIEGEKILRIADHIDGYENLPDVEIYDLSGKTVVPGYIDMHGPHHRRWWRAGTGITGAGIFAECVF